MKNTLNKMVNFLSVPGEEENMVIWPGGECWGSLWEQVNMASCLTCTREALKSNLINSRSLHIWLPVTVRPRPPGRRVACLRGRPRNVSPDNVRNSVRHIWRRRRAKCRRLCVAVLFRLSENEATAGRMVEVLCSGFTPEFKM